MTLLPPRGERALPLLSGALLALSYPPARFLIPPFLGLAPLLVFIAERPPGPEGRWAATRAGMVAGLVCFGLQLYWLAVALVFYSALAIPAYLGTVLALAGLTGAFGWAVHWTRERLRLPVWVPAVAFWTTLEWVQAHLGPLSFPWLGLGTALAPFPTLAAAADLVGARGLTVWVAAVNGLVAAAFLRFRAGRSERPALLALAVVVALPTGYGAWRTATLRMVPTARVALIQPNIPEELKLDRSVALDTSLTALRALTRQMRGVGLDLVVWPEVAVPVGLPANRPVMAEIRSLSREVDAPILAGAYGVGPGDPGPAFNSALLVDASGPRGDRYDKRLLVPFVERVPFIDPGLLRGGAGEMRYFGGLGRGHDAPLFRTEAGSGFGVLICYESIFAPLARRYRAAGADMLVNITNDAWFGREPWYARTTALWQHPAHLVMRAIETRAGVARAANTGISLFIDPLGRPYRDTPLFEPAVSPGIVYTTDAVTLYVRWGDWLATLVVLGAAAMIAAAWAAGRRQRGH